MCKVGLVGGCTIGASRFCDLRQDGDKHHHHELNTEKEVFCPLLA